LLQFLSAPDYTISISKDNEAARRRRPKRIFPYVEKADDAANKVSRRKRIDIIVYLSEFFTGIKTLRLAS
jgi:hypothetical protein